MYKKFDLIIFPFYYKYYCYSSIDKFLIFWIKTIIVKL